MIVRTLICLAVIAGVTLASDFIRSKYQTDLMDNANHFIQLTKNIPDEIGSWKRTEVKPLQDFAAEQLKVRDAEHWTYTNEETGEKVFISFLVGPTGRLSVHTPEVCLAGEGFYTVKKRQRERFALNEGEAVSLGETLDVSGELTDTESQDDAREMSSGHVDEFWRVAIGHSSTPGRQVVFYYALGTGKQWWAKENPRYELANYPFVLKMQVETYTADDFESYNSARTFLKVFLPEVEKVFAETDLEGMYGK